MSPASSQPARLCTAGLLSPKLFYNIAIENLTHRFWGGKTESENWDPVCGRASGLQGWKQGWDLMVFPTCLFSELSFVPSERSALSSLCNWALGA